MQLAAFTRNERNLHDVIRQRIFVLLLEQRGQRLAGELINFQRTLDTLRTKWFPEGKTVISDQLIGPGAYGTPTPAPK